MTVHHARSIALAAVLVGISALAPTTRLHAQQTLADREQLLRDAAAALAEQGYPLPSFALGGMYADGQGVPQDDAEAVRWYRLAADHGHAAAQHILGVMYENGGGVSGVAGMPGTEDYVEAHMWYNLAAAQSSGEERDISVSGRDAVAEHMTAEQIAEAQRRAREWQPTPEP